MANPTTAAEWQQAAANLNSQIDSLESQQTQLDQSIRQNSTQQFALRRELSATSDPAKRFEINQQLIQLGDQRTQIENQKSQLSQQIVTLDQQVQNAERQSSIASTGAPVTSTNTPPASSQPGDPTEPAATAATVPNAETDPVSNTSIQITTPQGTLIFPDQQTLNAWENNSQSVAFSTGPGGVQYVREVGPLPEPQKEVPAPTPSTTTESAPVDSPTDVGSEDPFEAQRIEAEQQLNRDELARQDPADIDPEFDPFEAQRLEAEQQLNDEQIENPFPDEVGPEDPFEQQRIEAEQQLNRDELARQDPADIDPEFDPFEQQRLEAEQRLNEEQIENAVPTPQEDFRRQELEQQPTFDQPDSAQSSFRRSELQAQSAEAQKQTGFGTAPDWRVRLSLAPSANYLYKANPPGPLLKPLAATNGVIFPYTPQINVQYGAHYDAPDIVHSNYKIYSYRNSAIDSISITGTFTAQDNNEANYLLAVIHFFRSVTKMFYGQDKDPNRGIPPPLCYLTGMGTYQFDNHPLAITNFNYNLPDDVDYIRAGQAVAYAGQSTAQYNTPTNTNSSVASRVLANRVPVGGVTPSPSFQARTPTNPTYVPTKMQIQITCIPIVTRKDISTRFSVKSYATGSLLQGSKNQGGGIW